ncbi:MAG: hypothetical protein L0241_10505 [Planctomycetia bacterium]|nr:hypothetical protein [Planctomycetia bacterium]
MPTPKYAQQIENLTKDVRELEKIVGEQAKLTEWRLKQLEEQLKERIKAEEQQNEKIAKLTEKNTALEERARNQEKTSDRGWQLWLAALGFGFGLISLLITAALQLKK